MSESPIRLRLEGIAKAYAAPVLRNISLELRAGEVHALLGENGAGKSTLGKIVCGHVQADAGRLWLDNHPFIPRDKSHAESLGLRMVRQELGIVGTLSVAENIFLADLKQHTRWRILNRRDLHQQARKYLELVGLSEVDPAWPAGSLGIGQQQAIEIAAALTKPCKLLVLDEPTASLSSNEVDKLFERIAVLSREGTTVVYVSHRLEEIRRVCDRLSILRDGELIHTGDAMATEPQEAVRLMIGRPLGALALTERKNPTGRTGLRVQGLNAGFVRNVSFTANQGEILGFAGLVGAGRTETLRALFGADPRQAGEIFVGENELPAKINNTTDAAAAGLAFLSEDRKEQGLLLPQSVANNMALGPLSTWVGAARASGLWRWVGKSLGQAETSSMANQLGVRCSDLSQPVVQLSGGNQQKVLIGRALLLNPAILIFDEPTRGIDVGARLEIYTQMRSLAAQGKTLLVASSDIHELMAIGDHIAVMSRGELTKTFARKDFDETLILAAALAPPAAIDSPPLKDQTL
jgi:ribose transport system ATP-binding protein